MSDELLSTIKVSYKSTSNAYIASQYLNIIRQHDVFSWDLEVATRYTQAERDAMQAELDSNPPKLRAIELRSTLAATALDHPSHCTITHCSIGISDHEAFVFILDNRSITNLILNFLVTTEIKQVLHNASYDFRHLLFHTGKMPINYEDTQIFAKTLVNHVETWKANTGLKDLAGRWYGAWAISSDNFTLDQMYEEHVLEYAAIDACSTYKLWTELNAYCKTVGDNHEY